LPRSEIKSRSEALDKAPKMAKHPARREGDDMRLWPWTRKTEANPVSGLPGDRDMQGAVEGHRRFRQRFEADKQFYEKLAQEQRPNLLWIGCSDSRVVPDIITGSDPGTLFVVRNIANIVPPAGHAEASVGAAIEYAVLHLGIDDIVVCGHSGCGGVQAMQSPVPPAETHLTRWVALGHTHAAADLDAAVKANILMQRNNLLTYDFVQERVAAGNLVIHGWLYDLSKGDLLAYDDEAQRWRTLGDADG
jgi:carbonic anhydrase